MHVARLSTLCQQMRSETLALVDGLIPSRLASRHGSILATSATCIPSLPQLVSQNQGQTFELFDLPV